MMPSTRTMDPSSPQPITRQRPVARSKDSDGADKSSTNVLPEHRRATGRAAPPSASCRASPTRRSAADRRPRRRHRLPLSTSSASPMRPTWNVDECSSPSSASWCAATYSSIRRKARSSTCPTERRIPRCASAPTEPTSSGGRTDKERIGRRIDRGMSWTRRRRRQRDDADGRCREPHATDPRAGERPCKRDEEHRRGGHGPGALVQPDDVDAIHRQRAQRRQRPRARAAR